MENIPLQMWELVSAELSTVNAKHDRSLEGGGQVALDHSVSVTRNDSEGEVRIIIGTKTTLVGKVEKDKEIFRISCHFKGTYHPTKKLENPDEVEPSEADTDFFGQQMFLVARPLLVSLLGQMKINPTFLPFTLPEGITVQEDDEEKGKKA